MGSAHIFAKVKLRSEEDLESWMKTFPDPSNSPAYHTHTLVFRGTTTDPRAVGSIQKFSRVTRLRLAIPESLEESDSLALFHKLSHTLKSLRVDFLFLSCTQILNFVCSFPLLEDLTLSGIGLLLGNDDDPCGPQTIAPSSSPAFTGTLDLAIYEGTGSIAPGLLDLPNGLHFRKFRWETAEDLEGITELVAGCSDTLECLDVACNRSRAFVLVLRWSCDLHPCVGDSSPASIDLSKAIRLKDVAFWPEWQSVEWITIALQTIKHQHLRQISICVHFGSVLTSLGANVGQLVGEHVVLQWLDLDHLLAQLWESHFIRPRIISMTPDEEQGTRRDSIGCLLPEITTRGIIDLVERRA